MIAVSEDDYRLLTFLANQPGQISVPELAEGLGLDQSKIAAICLNRSQTGEISIKESTRVELRLGKRGKQMAGKPFSERAILIALSQRGGTAELGNLADISGLDKKEAGDSLRWLKSKDWAEKAGSTLSLRPNGYASLDNKGADELLVEILGRIGSATEEELRAQGLDLDAALKLLAGRNDVIEKRERKIWWASLTDLGRSLVQAGLTPQQSVSQLTPELLRSGEWKQVAFRPYDVALPSRPTYPGKEHPMISIFEETRKVFLQMGFSESVGPYVESGFWDFDALFQPQDHPARDMQDTFYVSRPDSCRLPDEKLVERVANTHENGGDTGSVGWRYSWNIKLANQPVLRTHTTATTIRALSLDPNPPRKVFSVGPVFRRETVDYKHLPVFHQVDGIIVDEEASFAVLLGTLAAFYRKMGFERFQFRPAFFPYTSPSVEVFVWAKQKGDWVEMGGAGMFRPEVTIPLGCNVPVLAWGLGLERLALFRYGLSSIGELYRTRLSWLKETSLCR